jgi:hypothetical protein
MSQGRPLSLLAFHVMKATGLVSRLQLEEQRLVCYLMRIEDGYPNNPYHNKCVRGRAGASGRGLLALLVHLLQARHARAAVPCKRSSPDASLRCAASCRPADCPPRAPGLQDTRRRRAADAALDVHARRAV